MPSDPYDESFESGAFGNWNGLEAYSTSTQFKIQSTIKRAGFNYACRFSEGPGQVWPGNNTVRALAHNTNSGETIGQTHYWWNSIYMPNSGGEAITHDNLLWEIHNPASLYNLNQGALAPYAVHYRSGNLAVRIVTGNLTLGSGYAHFEPNLLLYTSPPKDQWIDYIFMIDAFSETSGDVKVWVDPTGTGTFTFGSPAISRTGIPTAQFCNAANVHNVTYYTEIGLYTGGSSISSTDVIYQIGGGREATFAAAVARLSGVAPTNPVNTVLPAISGSATVGQTLSCSTGTWTGSPTSYGYQWERDNAGGGTYVNIGGATANVYVLTNPDSDCNIRCSVTARN